MDSIKCKDFFVLSCNRMYATWVVPSEECLRGEGLVWVIGAVVCLLTAVSGPLMFVERAMDGRICAAAPLALADQLPLTRL